MACDWTGAEERVRRKQEEKKKNEKLNFYDSLRV